MALATRRAYAGAAPACTLSSDINASATSFSITGTVTNWPTTATGPFYMVIDPGLSTEEKVLVAARSTGSLSSVTRGVDGTVASSHVTGATCYPVFTAVDANDANLLASRLTAKGDLISTDGSDPTKVAVGTNGFVLVADSAQTSGFKWASFIPSGTLMLFQQTSAPTGWTKQTTHDNKALRVVTGSASSGGTNSFSAAFNTSFNTSGGSVANHTLTTSQIPSHSHFINHWSGAGAYAGQVPPGNGVQYGFTVTTSATGGDGSHNHSFTNPTFNLAVQYVDVIIASKD